MRRLTRRRLLAGGAAAILAGCTPAKQPESSSFPKPGTIPGPGATVSPADTALDSGEIDFPLDRDRIVCYRSRPRGNGPFPGVLILHDYRGLSPHMRDVARRLAKLGYVGLAIDFLSRSGGTDTTGEVNAITNVLNRIPPDRSVNDALAAISYLRDLPFIQRDSLGLLGFDYGATIGLQVAAGSKDLQGTAIFYGQNPSSLDRLKNISAPVFAIYPENDSKLRDGIAPLEAVLKQANVSFEYYVEPGVSRGFHNDANQSFNLEAAQDAWARTVGFLNRRLKK